MGKKMINAVILLACFTPLCVAIDNVMVGVHYRNYTNYDGTVADGTCCDNQNLVAPNCPPDECDTSFLPCATYTGGQQCKAFFENSTPITVNNNSFVIDQWIGNVNRSSSFVVFFGEYSPGDINVFILARENSNRVRTLIANFTFVIDSMDTFYSNPPNWKYLLLKDTRAELGLDVFYQCKGQFFGSTCSTHCTPTHQYNCLNDGTKNCTQGWKGLDCDELVPYCRTNLCQNGGTCVNLHLDYNCSCTNSYAGRHCEIDLTLPSTTTALVTEVPTSSSPPPPPPSSPTTTETTATARSIPSLKTTAKIVPAMTTTMKSAYSVPASKPPGIRNNNNSTAPSSKTTLASSKEDTTMVFAASITAALCLLGVVVSIAAYVYKRMKRSPVSPAERTSARTALSRDVTIEDLEEKHAARSPVVWT